jgi:hypothetical protein
MCSKFEESILMAYAAGIIDGDGSIHLQKKGKYLLPVVSVALSCEKLILFFLNNFGGRVTKSRKLHKWVLSKKKETKEFLRKCLPFMVEKKDLATAVIEGNIEESHRLNKYTHQNLDEGMNFIHSEKEAWAYTAGFMDSDGHITIKKRMRDSEKKKRNYPDYCPEIGCGGTDFRATNFISKLFGKGSIKIRPHKKCVNGKRLDFKVRIHSEIKEFLEKCSPFLVIKNKHSDVLLNYIEKYKAKIGGQLNRMCPEQLRHREDCYQSMKNLQIRGNWT